MSSQPDDDLGTIDIMENTPDTHDNDDLQSQNTLDNLLSNKKSNNNEIKELIQNLKNDIHNLELQLELSFELTEQEINNIRENIDEKNQLILKYILQ